MPTVQQIITYADRKYPNSESDANKIIDLNDIHNNIFTIISRLKNDYETYETATIANQLTYTLPSKCQLSNIISIRVSASATITTSTIWNEFEYAGFNEDVSRGYYWGRGLGNTIVLVENDLPLATAGLSIRITYYETPTQLSSVTDTPELDDYYHSLLKFGLIQELASQGQNPDTDIADYWQSKYDEFLNEVKKDLSEKNNAAPIGSAQIEEWW